MSVADPLGSAAGASSDKLSAIYIAILAVILAICAVGDDDASKSAVRANVLAADTYAFFQAKNIRQTSLNLAADNFEFEAMNPALDETARQFLREKIAAYRATAKRYESEPETGEGKKELLAKARSLEAERDIALARDPYFDLGQALLQIAIVLASASLILAGNFLMWMSGLLGVAGTLSTVNAFTLAVKTPFLG